MTKTSSHFDRAPAHRAGFLLAPLGWLNGRLAEALKTDPELCSVLFELDPYRMHLLGLALSATPVDPQPDFIRLLGQGQLRSIIDRTIGYAPTGLSRALAVLPNAVLPRESYRTLLELLCDSTTATYLHHRRSIDEPLIAGLADLPGPLRRHAMFKLFDKFEGMDRFARGLQFLSGRAGITFDGLIEQLACLDQTEQVMARIIDLIDALPLPDGLPNCEIGSFARVDSVTEIKALAKDWSNCLAEYLHDINRCTGAVYSSISGPPAVAFALRVDRLGWVLYQIKGPKNAELDPIDLARHLNAFGEAGIPRFADIAAIKDLVLRSRWPRI